QSRRGRRPRCRELGRGGSRAARRSARGVRLYPRPPGGGRRPHQGPRPGPLRPSRIAPGMGGQRMTRQAIAMRLAAIVALSGAVPLLLLALIGLQIVSRRGEQASQEALRFIAEQAGGRIKDYVAQQRQMLRAVAMAVGTEPDAPRRLADVALDAPSLGKVRLIDAQTPASLLPINLRPEEIVRALSGTEVASQTYLVELSPALDVCVPPGKPGSAVCATLDLLELQRQVQRIRIGESGYALAFDRTGRLLAAGAGTLRAAVLSGE